MKKDERVDAFINSAQPFARPILSHLRTLVHTACPEVEETIKWGMPNFGYKGMLCGIGAFKQHCAFNLFAFKKMKDAAMFEAKNVESMGHLGKITSLTDLPADEVIITFIKEAVKLNETKAKPVKKKTLADNKILYYPEGMKAALQENKTAGDVFEKFNYTDKKEYVQWIAEAKTEATRNKRITMMLQWLEEGKKRNWKYESDRL